MMKWIHVVSIAPFVVAAVGCGSAENDEGPIPGLVDLRGVEMIEHGDAALALPTLVLEPVEGVNAAFYLWEDESIGMLISGHSAQAYFSDLDLDHATPATVYWALSEAGSDVPSLLVAAQTKAASEENAPNWLDVVNLDRQGWALETTTPDFRHTDPCATAEFNSNHCPPPGSWGSGYCALDTNSNLSWTTGATRKWNAGFCLDVGNVNDYLYYQVQAADCNYFATANYIWGNPFSGDNWSAPTYWAWTWIAGASTASRKWKHNSYNAGGSDNYDWSRYQTNGTICG